MTPTAATETPSPRSQAIARALNEKFDQVPIESLVESPLNPRKTFNDHKLAELANSIHEKGIVEPLVVRELAAGSLRRFEIVCGARRFRAAQLAGVTHVPVVIRAYTDAQAIEIMAIENGQRDDVPPLEEAEGYKRLLGLETGYSAAMIAERIGRSEKYVWDRLRLLELVPEIQKLLVSGEIGVEHAEVIAKLKPAEQKSLLKARGYTGASGLFEPDHALAFDDSPAPRRPRKPVSVRELKQYIAEHVRLDVKHAAAAAPLEFGETAKRVEEAQAQPGRGRKVIPITFSHVCPDGARDPNERTYGATAWKKAVGKDGQPACEHAVLGVVVAGEHYGESFSVCIARDRCLTHWKESVQAKEKAARLRESGKGKQAAKIEKRTEENWEKKQERERAERAQREKAWTAIATPVIADAVAQVKGAEAITAAQAICIEHEIGNGWSFRGVRDELGARWFRQPAAALLLFVITNYHFSAWGNTRSGFDDFVREVAKPLGLNIKRLEAIRDQHQPKADATPAKTKMVAKNRKAVSDRMRKYWAERRQKAKKGRAA